MTDCKIEFEFKGESCEMKAHPQYHLQLLKGEKMSL